MQTLSNQFVPDSRAFQDEADSVNPWSDIEKCIFLDRFTQYPKNFKKIGSFLRNKTTSDCVEFYYNSKKFVNYKLLLREYSARRRLREFGHQPSYDVWSSTVAAARAGEWLDVQEGRLDGSVMIYTVRHWWYYYATGRIGDQRYA